MNDLYARHPANLRRRDYRRLLLSVVGVVLASGGWHLFRSALVRELARSSVGCPARAPLLAAVLAARFPECHPGWPVGDNVISQRKGATCFVMWAADWEFHRRWVFADGDLNLLGSLRTAGFDEPLAGDADRDGHIDVLAPAWLLGAQAAPDALVLRWAVVRLGGDVTELVAVIVADKTPWLSSAWGSMLTPTWRDEDGDGREELVFVGFKRGRLPGSRFGWLPAETVAVFEWDRPGGVLRPRRLPADNTFLVWVPPDGQPTPFSPDQPLDELVSALLSIPQDFGSSSASRPTSAPATQAVSP